MAVDNSLDACTQSWAENDSLSPEDGTNSNTLNSVSHIIPSSKKRKTKSKTPIVDDEVRRCSRFKKGARQEHVQLDNEPRRKKGANRKFVSFSTVAELKNAIISRSLEEDMDEVVIDAIPEAALVDLGNSFCGVPPVELSLASFQHHDATNEDA